MVSLSLLSWESNVKAKAAQSKEGGYLISHLPCTHRYRIPRKSKNIKKAKQGYFRLVYLIWPGDGSKIFVSSKTVAVSRSTTDQPTLPSAFPN